MTLKGETIEAIILAAGDSRRMGFPKALLPLGNGVFITRILDTLETVGLTEPIIVLGRHSPLIEPRIVGRRIRTVINQFPDLGQISSVQLAIRNLGADCDGCLVWPVDQPAIPASVVANLIDLFFDSGALIAYPTCRQTKGHPVIFRRSLFWELLHCPAEYGARSVVARHLGDTTELPTDEISTITDIDTPEDYFGLTGKILDAGTS